MSICYLNNDIMSGVIHDGGMRFICKCDTGFTLSDLSCNTDLIKSLIWRVRRTKHFDHVVIIFSNQSGCGAVADLVERKPPMREIGRFIPVRVKSLTCQIDTCHILA